MSPKKTILQLSTSYTDPECLYAIICVVLLSTVDIAYLQPKRINYGNYFYAYKFTNTAIHRLPGGSDKKLLFFG